MMSPGSLVSSHHLIEMKKKRKNKIQGKKKMFTSMDPTAFSSPQEAAVPLQLFPPKPPPIATGEQ